MTCVIMTPYISDPSRHPWIHYWSFRTVCGINWRWAKLWLMGQEEACYMGNIRHDWESRIQRTIAWEMCTRFQNFPWIVLFTSCNVQGLIMETSGSKVLQLIVDAVPHCIGCCHIWQKDLKFWVSYGGALRINWIKDFDVWYWILSV